MFLSLTALNHKIEECGFVCIKGVPRREQRSNIRRNNLKPIQFLLKINIFSFVVEVFNKILFNYKTNHFNEIIEIKYCFIKSSYQRSWPKFLLQIFVNTDFFSFSI